jgi:hypothetical protein
MLDGNGRMDVEDGVERGQQAASDGQAGVASKAMEGATSAPRVEAASLTAVSMTMTQLLNASSRPSLKYRFDRPHYSFSIEFALSRSFTEQTNQPLALLLITQPLNQEVLQIIPELIILQHLSSSVMSMRKSFGFGLSVFG